MLSLWHTGVVLPRREAILGERSAPKASPPLATASEAGPGSPPLTSQLLGPLVGCYLASVTSWWPRLSHSLAREGDPPGWARASQSTQSSACLSELLSEANWVEWVARHCKTLCAKPPGVGTPSHQPPQPQGLEVAQGPHPGLSGALGEEELSWQAMWPDSPDTNRRQGTLQAWQLA